MPLCFNINEIISLRACLLSNVLKIVNIFFLYFKITQLPRRISYIRFYLRNINVMVVNLMVVVQYLKGTISLKIVNYFEECSLFPAVRVPAGVRVAGRRGRGQHSRAGRSGLPGARGRAGGDQLPVHPARVRGLLRGPGDGMPGEGFLHCAHC